VNQISRNVTRPAMPSNEVELANGSGLVAELSGTGLIMATSGLVAGTEVSAPSPPSRSLEPLIISLGILFRIRPKFIIVEVDIVQVRTPGDEIDWY
jgi:hypothetical protein